jgi:hypothetical protein
MVWFDKLDCPISSVLVAVRGTIGSDEDVLFPAKWHLTMKENTIHDNSRSCGSG